MKLRISLISLFLFLVYSIKAQDVVDITYDVDDLKVPFVMHDLGETMYQGEKISWFRLPTLYVYPPIRFKNKKQEQHYNRLVLNVKKTLPIAKLVKMAIVETYDYLETLPTKRERDEHIRLVEKGLKKQYTPMMKQLTYSQGKLLIKLIDRECNQSSYELVKAFMGGFKATAYNTFASLFGASLKKGYDEEGDDKLVERIVLMIESGQL